MQTYAQELKARVEYQLTLPSEEQMFFVVAEQVGGSGTPSRIFLHGPSPAYKFRFEYGGLHGPTSPIDIEMIAGFFEVESDIEVSPHSRVYGE